MEIKEMAYFAAKTLSEKKAMDIAIIDVSQKAGYTDYFVIASGGNERQISALVDNVEEEFEKEGIFVKHIEGKKTSGWILLDYEDIIVNIMTEEMRTKFSIERLWGDCNIESYSE